MDNDIFGIAHLPENVKEDLQDRIEIIIHKLKFFPEKPKVAVVHQLEPLQLANNLLIELVKIAGGTPLPSDLQTWEQILSENPEYIVIILSGQDLTSAMRCIPNFLNLPQWNDIAAVQNNKIYIADSVNYFEHSGEKAVEAVEALAEIITPKYFNFGMEGKVWLKFDLSA